MGSAELRAHFPKKGYMVTVPTYMMTILMLFNEVEKLTYQDIRETTQIPVAELDRCLLTLVMGKSKLLVKSSKGGGGSKSGKEKPKLEDGDEFSVNDKFTSTHTKYKIQTAKATRGEGDRAQTPP